MLSQDEEIISPFPSSRWERKASLSPVDAAGSGREREKQMMPEEEEEEEEEDVLRARKLSILFLPSSPSFQDINLSSRERK